MIPILLVSKNRIKIKDYLKKIKREDSITFEIKPEEKEFSINQIKNLIKETAIFNKNNRIYLLEDFYLSSIEAQNSFLKLLEEPPDNVLFVLTTDNEEKLIPTIRSRTKIVYLEKNKTLELDLKLKELLSGFITSKTFNFPAEQFSLDEIILFFKERLANDIQAPAIIKEALKLKTLSERNNLIPQLTIDHMLIFIKKQYTMKIDP